MFGKRPTPDIFHLWQLGGAVSPASYAPVVSHLPTAKAYALGERVSRNHGTTLAEDLDVNDSFILPGPECMLHAPNIHEWTRNESMLGWHHIIAPEGYRLPPGGMLIPVCFQVLKNLRSIEASGTRFVRRRRISSLSNREYGLCRRFLRPLIPLSSVPITAARPATTSPGWYSEPMRRQTTSRASTSRRPLEKWLQAN